MLCLFVLPDFWALLAARSELSSAKGTTKSAVGFLLPDILHTLLPDVSEDHSLIAHFFALEIIIRS